jgi:hypothetical protein
LSLIADPGAALTVIAMDVVPVAGAKGPIAVAAPDALGTGDVLEDKELSRKEIYSELNLAMR